ncbi:MAG: hypothetical protein J7D61_10530, partial [Marichromatium sp.]|nr:hypothetical protein [Marichromatium sp.]
MLAIPLSEGASGHRLAEAEALKMVATHRVEEPLIGLALDADDGNVESYYYSRTSSRRPSPSRSI